MMDLKDKTAFVTGAASGIGFGIASGLARAGVRLMLCDIDEAGLAGAAERLRSSGADVDTVRADVSVKSDIEAAARKTIDRFGKVHILVNNAGILDSSQYGSWTDTGWDWTLSVNLRSAIWGFEIFGPLLESHGEGGHIVSTASVGGLSSSPYVAYNVSKYGIVALSEGLRAPLRERGIGVSVLCPGSIRTQIMNSIRAVPDRFKDGVKDWPGEGSDGDAYRNMVAGIEQGISPDYVGDLVCEAIEQDWDYILTDTRWEEKTKTRLRAIEAAFDRIRDRTPY